MTTSEKKRFYQKVWREKNREKVSAYFKKRREEIKILNAQKPMLKSDKRFSNLLENPKSWEERYRKAFEKAYGKIT